MGDYVAAFGSGVVLAAAAIVFALTAAVLVGRWVMAEESGFGVLVRTAALGAIYAFGITHFHTRWFLAAVVLAPLPLVDALWRGQMTARWVRQRRRERSAQAVREVATDPANAMARLRLGQALLEEGHIEVGLEALEAAVALASEDSKPMLRQMGDEAREEFVRECPSCGARNPVAGVICRRCLVPFDPSPLVRVAAWCCRPVLRYLHS